MNEAANVPNVVGANLHAQIRLRALQSGVGLIRTQKSNNLPPPGRTGNWQWFDSACRLIRLCLIRGRPRQRHGNQQN